MCGNNQDLTDDNVDIQIPSMVEITIQSDKYSTSVFAQKLSSTIGLEQINVFQQSAGNSTIETQCFKIFNTQMK